MRKKQNKARMIYQTEETRNKILDIAEKTFIKKGLFETTMKDLAVAIGISRASLYRYYQDKLDLSLAIMGKIVNELLSTEVMPAKLEKLPDGISKLEFYLREVWLSDSKIDTYRFLAEFDAYFSGFRIPAGFRQKLQKIIKTSKLDTMIDFIKQGIKDGSVRKNLNMELVPEIILNAVRSLQQRLILRGNVLIELNENDLGKVMDEYIIILMNGIRNNNK